MKKIILCISITLCFYICYGQEKPEPTLKFRSGIVAGLNFSQVDGDNYAGYNKVGFNAGFASQIPVSKHFFVSAEILYSQKGSKSPTYKGVPLAFLWKLNYAEVPVLINFQEKSAINFGAGLSYNQLLRARLFRDGLEQADAAEGISKSDLNVVVNANYLFTKHFQLNVRF